MQNKSAIRLFTILLGLASLYILSFSLVADKFETKADEYAETFRDSLANTGMSVSDVDKEIEGISRKYLKDSANVVVYPVVGKTYKEVKEQELNLGLDLQGGMSVTLEVSISELLIAMSDNNDNPHFVKAIQEAKDAQKSAQADFITLFEEAWANQNAGFDLYQVFNTYDSNNKFSKKMTDEETFAILREEAEIAINNTENIIRKRIDQFGVAQPNVQKESVSGRIIVELPGVDDRERVRKQLKSTANLEFWNAYFNAEVAQYFGVANQKLSVFLYPDLGIATDEAASTDESVDNITDENDDNDSDEDLATDDLSTDEPIDTTDANLAGDDLNLGDVVDEEGSEDAVEEELSEEELKKRNPLFADLIPNPSGRSCVLGWASSADTAEINNLLVMDVVKSELPDDLLLYWSANTVQLTNNDGEVGSYHELYTIKDTSNKGKAELDGSTIIDSSADFNEFGEPIVSMTMNAEGSAIWKRMTELNAADNNRPVAIVMDRLVYSAPFVNETIPTGRSQISMGGDGSVDQRLGDAKDLSGLLKAGSLPAPAKIVDEYTVGPSLGQENINAGMISFAIALLVILLYMIFYYKGAGVVSNIALLANIFLLIGALASMHASLTLPGIAGIVLTIGMAVDANVLIFERIREEMRHGKGLGAAVKDGYQKAYSAILDANITTLLTAIVLFAFGSGPIKGFATTLIIGIFTSLFSAIIITRLIFFARLENKKPISFSTNLTKDWFTKIDFQFIAKRKMFYIISAVIVAGGIVSIATKNFQYGVDFKGGTAFTVEFADVVDGEQIKDVLKGAFNEGEGKTTPATVQSIGGAGNSYKITTNYLIESEDVNVEKLVTDALKSGLNNIGTTYDVSSYNKVDPTISDDFRRGAMYATIFSLLIIFLYIFFRFRKWQYGIGALIAMTHDVLIVLGLFSIFYGILPFTLEVNQAFIAAILTVIGYSINDTVVVFDRIREFLHEHKNDSEKTIINRALNSTLSRTINTSLSTFIVLLMIFIFGGDSIKGFSFALMVGVVVGTYSSLFIATPAVIDLSKSARTED